MGSQADRRVQSVPSDSVVSTPRPPIEQLNSERCERLCHGSLRSYLVCAGSVAHNAPWLQTSRRLHARRGRPVRNKGLLLGSIWEDSQDSSRAVWD